MRPAELEPENRITPPAVPPERWADGALDVMGAARFLACSRKHIFALMKDGRLPWGRLGGRRRIPRRALVDLLAGDGEGGG